MYARKTFSWRRGRGGREGLKKVKRTVEEMSGENKWRNAMRNDINTTLTEALSLFMNNITVKCSSKERLLFIVSLC